MHYFSNRPQQQISIKATMDSANALNENESGTINSSSSDDEIQEDTDAFLFSIESKLRSEFSSLELSKSISSSHQSKKRYIRLLSKTFEQMAKPIKLRVLVALLSLDSFQVSPKHQKRIQDIFISAEGDDDQWVRILAGMIQGTMYVSQNEEKHDEQYSYDGAALKLLEKTCNSVLKDVEHHGMTVSALRNEFASKEEESNESDTEMNPNIKSDRLVADLAPLFAPLRYSLLSSKDLHSIMPECYDNDHFVPDMNASILKVDEEQEQRKAEEERKEMIKKLEQERRLEELRKKKKREMPTSSMQKTMVGRGGRGRIMAGRGAMMRGRGTPSAGRGKIAGRGKRGLDSSGGSSFMRAPKKTMVGKPGMARGSLGVGLS